MEKITIDTVKTIRRLRRKGHSFPEIKRLVDCSVSTIYRYSSKVSVSKRYQEQLKSKQGGSKARASLKWKIAQETVSPIIGSLSKRDKLLILAALYWGEGTKKELNIINGDSKLLKVFLECIAELGINRSDLVFSIRVFGNMSISESKKFWGKELKIPLHYIVSVEKVPGSGEDRLRHGMCRIRMRKSERYFKLVMSMIELISLRI